MQGNIPWSTGFGAFGSLWFNLWSQLLGPWEKVVYRLSAKSFRKSDGYAFMDLEKIRELPNKMKEIKIPTQDGANTGCLQKYFDANGVRGNFPNWHSARRHCHRISATTWSGKWSSVGFRRWCGRIDSIFLFHRCLHGQLRYDARIIWNATSTWSMDGVLMDSFNQ